MTKQESKSNINLEHLHSVSSEIRPGISRNMSLFERGLIDKINELSERVDELERQLKVK